MKHDQELPCAVDGFKKLAFGSRIKRMMARVRALPTMRIASIAEAQAAMAVARQTLDGLMDDATLERVLSHNPAMFQIVTGEGIPADKTVFNAMIPLTEAGVLALLAGEFRGANPDLTHIARPGHTPAALYGALMFTPAAFGPAMKALTYQIGALAPQGCPLFSRPITPHTRRLFPEMGFLPAGDIYPDAPAGLMVILPEAAVAVAPIDDGRVPAETPPQPVLAVRVARTIDDMMKVFTIRAATYMSEQSCPYDEEFDGNDFCAMHLIGEIDGEPAGCLRMRFFGDFVKMERLAVRTEFRSTKLAFRMVREGIELCRRKGFTHIYGHARADLVRFWSVFGFRPIAGRPRFTFSGIEYVEMEGPIPRDRDRIAVGADPYTIIRPEGRWDEPGPLDRSRDRGAAVMDHVRTIGGRAR